MLLRQTLLYLPAQVLGPVLQMLAVFAWAWWLPAADLGAFTLITAAQELGYMLSLSWFSAYALRYYTATGPHRPRARQAAEMLVIAVAAVFNTALAGLMIVWLFGPAAAWAAFPFAATFMVLRTLATHLAERARALHRIGVYTWLQLTGPGLALAIGALLAASGPLRAADALLASAAAHLVAVAPALWLLEVRLAPPRLAAVVLRRALDYGLPLVLGGGLSWLSLNLTRYLIQLFEGAHTVGLTAVGMGLGLRGAAMAAMLVTAATFPLAVKAAEESGLSAGMQQQQRNGVLLMLTLFPAVAGLIAITGDVARLLLADTYRAATIIALPLTALAGLFFNLRVHFVDQVFLLAGRTRFTLLMDVVSVGFGLLLAPVGYWLAGHWWGLFAAFAVAELLALLVAHVLAWRICRFAFPWKRAARLALASLAMLAVLHGVPAAHDMWSLAGRIALGALTYAALLAVLFPCQTRRAAGYLRRHLSFA